MVRVGFVIIAGSMILIALEIRSPFLFLVMKLLHKSVLLGRIQNIKAGFSIMSRSVVITSFYKFPLFLLLWISYFFNTNPFDTVYIPVSYNS